MRLLSNAEIDFRVRVYKLVNSPDLQRPISECKKLKINQPKFYKRFSLN
jgi:hypothetical protein